MKNKASFLLMELLVMVLIFALASAVCLRCFLWAANTAEETALQDRAVTLAQNAAEAIKATGNIPAAKASVQVPDGLALEITMTEPEIPGLGGAAISVMGSCGKVLFALETAWQEVPDE